MTQIVSAHRQMLERQASAYMEVLRYGHRRRRAKRASADGNGTKEGKRGPQHKKPDRDP
jgi:hypothetical protein